MYFPLVFHLKSVFSIYFYRFCLHIQWIGKKSWIYLSLNPIGHSWCRTYRKYTLTFQLNAFFTSVAQLHIFSCACMLLVGFMLFFLSSFHVYRIFLLFTIMCIHMYSTRIDRRAGTTIKYDRTEKNWNFLHISKGHLVVRCIFRLLLFCRVVLESFVSVLLGRLGIDKCECGRIW